MNLLGKLLIVLIFIGSIGLASFSVALYATHTNWKERADKLETALKGKEQELKSVTNQRDEMVTALKNENDRREANIIALETKVEQLTVHCEEANNKIAEKEKELEVWSAAVQASHETAERLRERYDGVSKALHQAQNQWVEMSSELSKMTDKAHGLTVQVTNYQSTMAQLAEDYRAMAEVLRMHGLSPDPALYSSHPPSGIHGSVTEVRQGGTVELSIGSDSGLVKGHQLDVIRNRDGRSSYVGKVVIIDTVADRAVAKVMPEFRRGVVQRGDEVTYIEVHELVAH